MDSVRRTDVEGRPPLVPKASRVPDDMPQVRGGHSQEHVRLLYHVMHGKPLNQGKAVALATAAAILGRDAAYSGKRIHWRDMMTDPNRIPELYNEALVPMAEDFEKDDDQVRIPKEDAYPVPGRRP